jgi:hypothetical protein
MQHVCAGEMQSVAVDDIMPCGAADVNGNAEQQQPLATDSVVAKQPVQDVSMSQTPSQENERCVLIHPQLY